ncbi:hypothetical protein BY996DRAFT_8396847 [Phakopsora pachyrhizi]|nr:hypothetical protein BY996DRAFT_6468509 [Phakopsora pachyrhizi]KAI8449762.1 hypothetical protein BY996DRAFT_8396847 [Phakopsora pachyrhizi]
MSNRFSWLGNESQGRSMSLKDTINRRVNSQQNSECGEPIQLDAPLDRDPDQASTLRNQDLPTTHRSRSQVIHIRTRGARGLGFDIGSIQGFSDDSQDATILIPYDRFDIILAFHGSIINLLSNLMKAYQTYLRSIDSIPSDYQFFVDDCRYSIGTITNLTKRYSDLLLRADAESRLTPLGPVQVIRLDHDPIDGQGNDENNNGNNNSSSIDNDENNSSDNANLNSSSNNNNTEIVDEEFPGYIFVVPDIHLTRIRNLLKVLELFILFINKVSHLSEEFKDWGYDQHPGLPQGGPEDLSERQIEELIGSDRRIEYDDPSLDVREKFGSEPS